MAARSDEAVALAMMAARSDEAVALAMMAADHANTSV